MIYNGAEYHYRYNDEEFWIDAGKCPYLISKCIPYCEDISEPILGHSTYWLTETAMKNEVPLDLDRFPLLDTVTVLELGIASLHMNYIINTFSRFKGKFVTYYAGKWRQYSDIFQLHEILLEK